MTFEEACSAVADLYEAAPETYCVGTFWEDDAGRAQEKTHPSVCRWCAVGGVILATERSAEFVSGRLERFVIAYSPTETCAWAISDRGIEHAIRLLRLAAGEAE